MDLKIEQEYHYSDIYLIPRKTIVDSRKECNTSVKFGPFTFAMPVYPANMKSVVNQDTCIHFAKRNWFYTMHRFNIDPVAFCNVMLEQSLFTSISIGVNEDSYADLQRLLEESIVPDYITVDIANCWCSKGERMIKYIKNNFPASFLIAGNIATAEAVTDLEAWGADALKVGQSGGSVCTTKLKTGFHRPMVNTVIDCVAAATKPIIADGGIVSHGDIAKALALGADMVMAGGMFAGYEESAGDTLEINGHRKKAYFGSASETNKGEYKNVEGKQIFVDYKGPIDKLLNELKEDIQSAISYSGGCRLSDLTSAKVIYCNK